MRAPWFIACLFVPSVAFAQTAAPAVPCMESASFAELLLAQYGERPVVEGADGRGMPVRWFANPESGSWTMAVYPKPDVACHALDGQSFRPATVTTGELQH